MNTINNTHNKYLVMDFINRSPGEDKRTTTILHTECTYARQTNIEHNNK